MIIFDGKRAEGHKNIQYLEAQLSKELYNPNVVGLYSGYYNYAQREYPPMAQWYFGQINKQVYDIDFNNFFLRAFKEYILKNNITSKPAKQNLMRLNRIINRLQKEREELKQRYILIYNPTKVRTVSNEVAYFVGYGDNKPTSRSLRCEVGSICGDYISADTLIDLADKLSRNYTGHYTVINKYQYLKYLHLSGIGWLKRKNEQLWWNIMKHATETMKGLIDFCLWNGYEVYNCYIDSIQVNKNLLKKHPHLFEIYTAKMDKQGSDYGLVLPPSYWIDREKAQWLAIDYHHWFKKGRTEELTTDNIKLLYLKSFATKVGHPIKEYIEIDNKTVITHKLDNLEYSPFRWDFVPIKTEAEKVCK